MFGEISAWYYKALGGIKPDPEYPGFKNVLLEPHFASGLEHFEARHLGPYGEIISAWKRADGKVLYRVTIPPNSTAKLTLSGSDVSSEEVGVSVEKQRNGQFMLELESGSYEFIVTES